jgi:hypothetical protein
VRTRYGRDEFLVALASEVHAGVAVRELVCRLRVGEMMQHGLLHCELLPKSHDCLLSQRVERAKPFIVFTSLVKVCV